MTGSNLYWSLVMSARILLPSTYVDYRSSSFLAANIESILNHLNQVQLIRREHGLEAALIEVSNTNGRVAASAISFASSFHLNSAYHITGSLTHLNALEEDLDFNNLRNLFSKYIVGQESKLPTRMYVSIINIDGAYHFKYIIPVPTDIGIKLSVMSEHNDISADCTLLSPFDSLGYDIAFATGVEYTAVGFSKYDGAMDESSLSLLSFAISLVSTYNKLLLNAKCEKPSSSFFHYPEMLWSATQTLYQLMDSLALKGFKLFIEENRDRTLAIVPEPKSVEVFDIFSLPMEGEAHVQLIRE